MHSFEIGLTGLDAAQKALDTIGNNIANAATEGYHRQHLELAPATPFFDGQFSLGTGVEVLGISRAIDALVEEEIVNQNSLSEQTAQELTTLHTIETTFGEMSDGGLSQAIDQFFSAMQDLATHPSEVTWQRQFVTAAQSMANQVRTIGASLADMADRVDLLISETVTRINELAAEIAALNERIQETEIVGSTANNLRDQRDQRIADLSKLVGVDLIRRDYGVVDVTAAGVPLVIDSEVTEIESGYLDADTMGIGSGETSLYRTVDGGKLGGLLSVRNDLLAEIRDQFDLLAATIIQQVNAYHVQGVGSAGSFSELTGWTVDSDVPLEDLGLDITDGTLAIRVTNTDTGEVRRVEVDVDVSADTLETIAAKIAATTGLDANIVSDKLVIEAESGYEFDFLPAPLPEPDDTDFATPADAPTIVVSGLYTGDENDVLTFTVQDGGSTGNGDWSIVVTNQDGGTVRTFDLGSGYVAGEPLDLGNGIKVSLGMGDLSDGDTFTVGAFADTDTADLLATVGLNVLFRGTDAQSMAVCSGFDETPGRVATALGADYADNVNIARMTALRDEALDALSGRTIGDYYDILVTSLGQDITLKEMRQDNTEAMLQNLLTKQAEISGVNVNDEAALILVYEQMYQAMAKFMNTVQTATETLFDLL